VAWYTHATKVTVTEADYSAADVSDKACDNTGGTCSGTAA